MEGNNKWDKTSADSSCTKGKQKFKPIHVLLMHTSLIQKAVPPAPNNQPNTPTIQCAFAGMFVGAEKRYLCKIYVLWRDLCFVFNSNDYLLMI